MACVAAPQHTSRLLTLSHLTAHARTHGGRATPPRCCACADGAHIHVVARGCITTITSNKRYTGGTQYTEKLDLFATAPGSPIPLYNLQVSRFRTLTLTNDEQFFGVGAYSLWISAARYDYANRYSST